MTFQLKNSTIIILLILWLLPIGMATANGGRMALGLNIQSSGDLLSLNATGAQNTKSLNIKSSLVQIGDGDISPVWENVPLISVPSFGDKGAIASIYEENHVYFLLKQDIEGFTWIALQWDTERSVDPGEDMVGMHPGDDMWVFGETTKEITLLGDGISAGPDGEFAKPDAIDNLFWERILINDTEGNPDYYAWEIQRLLKTGDIDGGDVEFSPENSVHLMMASNKFHKQNDPIVMNFILSEEHLTGEAPIIVEVPTKEKIDATGVFLKYTTFGILLGMFTYMFVFFPVVFILRKQGDE